MRQLDGRGSDWLRGDARLFQGAVSARVGIQIVAERGGVAGKRRNEIDGNIFVTNLGGMQGVISNVNVTR